MTNNEQVLLESQAARSSQLAQIDDQAEDLLSKAKALHFNVWQGTGIATTEQVAEFYEVPIETVSKAAKRHRVEFESDGLKVLRGKELGVVMDKLSITNKARNLTIWNPRATLRLGYLLRDSAIAKAVRSTSLDFIEQAAKPKAAPPKSQAEMLLAFAQQLVDQEQQIKSVAKDVQEIKQRSINAVQQLESAVLPPASMETPVLATRRALLHAVNLYCQKEIIDQKKAWNLLYEQLRLRCGFAVKNRSHLKNETHLDVVVRHGHLEQTYAIALEYFGLQQKSINERQQ